MAIKLLWLGAAGHGAIMVLLANRKGLFRKHGVDVELAALAGAGLPQLDDDVPVGYIGAPAVMILVAGGADLRILASLDTARISGCLVARPEIRAAAELRGSRLGARLVGAKMWVHTVTALEKLGLDPRRDGITIDPIGDPAVVYRALAAGEIDGAVVARAQAEQLAAQGYNILLDLDPLELGGAPDAVVATGSFVAGHPDAAQGIVAAMVEATALFLSPGHRPAVIEAAKEVFAISDDAAAEKAIRDLAPVTARKPYPSVQRLSHVQHIIATVKPPVGDVAIPDLIDDHFVSRLDANGFIDRIYDEYGAA